MARYRKRSRRIRKLTKRMNICTKMGYHSKKVHGRRYRRTKRTRSGRMY